MTSRIPRLILFSSIFVLLSCRTSERSNSAGHRNDEIRGAVNGQILESSNCIAPRTEADFITALTEYYQSDILEAGLGESLKKAPLTDIFKWKESESLARATDLGRCKRVIYSSGGLRVAGFMLLPASPGPHPVLIWLRGGNRDFGKIEPVTLLNPFWFAEAGFIVLATQYRGADGGEGVDEFGGSDIEDVLALLPLAKSIRSADVSRTYMVGASRGAMEGLMAIRKGLSVKAAAFRGGLYDLPKALELRPEIEQLWSTIIPGFGKDRARVLGERSAVQWAEEIPVPTLLLHGREDWRASLDSAQHFADKLRSVGTKQRLTVFEQDEHQLVFHRMEWLEETKRWFERAPFDFYRMAK